jgi:hypothetical protein
MKRSYDMFMRENNSLLEKLDAFESLGFRQDQSAAIIPGGRQGLREDEDEDQDAAEREALLARYKALEENDDYQWIVLLAGALGLKPEELYDTSDAELQLGMEERRITRERREEKRRAVPFREKEKQVQGLEEEKARITREQFTITRERFIPIEQQMESVGAFVRKHILRSQVKRELIFLGTEDARDEALLKTTPWFVKKAGEHSAEAFRALVLFRNLAQWRSPTNLDSLAMSEQEEQQQQQTESPPPPEEAVDLKVLRIFYENRQLTKSMPLMGVQLAYGEWPTKSELDYPAVALLIMGDKFDEVPRAFDIFHDHPPPLLAVLHAYPGWEEEIRTQEGEARKKLRNAMVMHFIWQYFHLAQLQTLAADWRDGGVVRGRADSHKALDEKMKDVTGKLTSAIAMDGVFVLQVLVVLHQFFLPGRVVFPPMKAMPAPVATECFSSYQAKLVDLNDCIKFHGGLLDEDLIATPTLQTFYQQNSLLPGWLSVEEPSLLVYEVLVQMMEWLPQERARLVQTATQNERALQEAQRIMRQLAAEKEEQPLHVKRGAPRPLVIRLHARYVQAMRAAHLSVQEFCRPLAGLPLEELQTKKARDIGLTTAFAALVASQLAVGSKHSGYRSRNELARAQQIDRDAMQRLRQFSYTHSEQKGYRFYFTSLQEQQYRREWSWGGGIV